MTVLGRDRAGPVCRDALAMALVDVRVDVREVGGGDDGGGDHAKSTDDEGGMKVGCVR